MKTRQLCILMAMMAGVSAGCAASSYSGTAQPRSRQSIQTFRPDGSREAYGSVENGRIELFNPDGSRKLIGTVK